MRCARAARLAVLFTARSISAPTIAGFWSPSLRAAAFSSSTPSPASFALAKACCTTGLLSDAAMNRTIDALKICSDKMRRRGVSRSRLIATEACRIAANSGEFIDRVRRETGLDLEIVTRETEAKLAVSGCASLIDRNCDWALVFDIGGGSSELIWLDLTRLERPVAAHDLRPTRRAELHRRLDLAARSAWSISPSVMAGANVTPRELRGHGART